MIANYSTYFLINEICAIRWKNLTLVGKINGKITISKQQFFENRNMTFFS